MANFIFNGALRLIMARDAGAPYIELETQADGDAENTTADRIRLLLTTVDASTLTGVRDVEYMDDLEGLAGWAEFSGTGYAAGGGGTVGFLANARWKPTTIVAGNNFSYLEADDVAWGGINTSTTPIVGCVMWYGDGNKLGVPTSTDIPIAYFDFAAIADTSDLTMQWGSIPGVTSSAGKGVVLKLTG